MDSFAKPLVFEQAGKYAWKVIARVGRVNQPSAAERPDPVMISARAARPKRHVGPTRRLLFCICRQLCRSENSSSALISTMMMTSTMLTTGLKFRTIGARRWRAIVPPGIILYMIAMLGNLNWLARRGILKTGRSADHCVTWSVNL
jgi:hypothetical protein